MTSFFDNGPLPDWKEIRQWLSKDIPWHLVEKWDKMQDGAWLDKFIDRLIHEHGEPVTGKVAKEAKQPAKANINDYMPFRIAKHPHKLSVSVQLPKGANMHELRLYAGSDRLRVAGLPGGRSRSVKLPCLVYPKSGRTTMKDGIMRIEFRRKPSNREEVELFIRP